MLPLALAAAAVVALAWWWLQPAAEAPAPAVVAATPAPALPSPFGSGPAVVGPDATPPAAAPAPVAAAAPVPPEPPAEDGAPGLPLAELKELKAQLAAEGPARDEAGLMAEHLLFADATLRLKHLRLRGGDAAELRGVAQIVDETLDTQLARGEVTPGEARDLKASVLQVIEPDAARRQALLAQWLQRHPPN